MNASGKCLCGAVSFEAENVTSHFHSCHCTMCRRWCGGPMMATHVERIRFTEQEHLHRYDSSPWAERGFCERCGSNLFYRVKDQDQYFVATGVFDDQSRFQLDGEIYIEEKPQGYNFAGDHIRQTGAEFMASLPQDND